jgi:hypothetical protein
MNPKIRSTKLVRPWLLLWVLGFSKLVFFKNWILRFPGLKTQFGANIAYMFSFIHYTSLDSWPAYKLLRIDQSNMCSHTHNYLMNRTQLWQRDWHLRMSGEARKHEEPVACILCLIVRSSRKHYLLLKKELAVANCWVKLLQ